MTRFSRGSEWRKWDLHIHPPGTKLNDGYKCSDGQSELDVFCHILHNSEVQAFGITDYFSLDVFFVVKEQFYSLYPDSSKILFPNLELRLNEAVNKADEVVDFHIIFRPDLTKEQGNEFLTYLKTQLTDHNAKQKACTDLTSADLKGATVSRSDIDQAIKDTFGSKAVRVDHCLMIAPVNNNGIRADKRSQRKRLLSDEIDKFADGFFGNPHNTEYFLKSERFDNEQKVAPKPVFAGCDAHNFDDLRAWLGLEVGGNNQKHITWVKADLTYEGLQQTFIEPSERVRLQTAVPDAKAPYKVISKITFCDTDKFPNEVVFNPGLNAIIGSRSAGKSALLAYLAHAVNPEYAVQQQVATGMNASTVGPGASITWEDVSDIQYSVEWQSPVAKEGQVIYVPQNSLYAISERPDEITAKIKPVVFRNDADFEVRYKKIMEDVNVLNESISDSVAIWYALETQIKELEQEIRNLGDRDAVIEQRDELEKKIKALQESSALKADEVEAFQRVIQDIGKSETRVKEIVEEQKILGQYTTSRVNGGDYEATNDVSITIGMTPTLRSMPNALREQLENLINSAKQTLLEKVKLSIVNYRSGLDTEQVEVTNAIEKRKNDNKDLIEKSEANHQVAVLVKRYEDQKKTVDAIDERMAHKDQMSANQAELYNSIAKEIKDRDLQLKKFVEKFNATDHGIEGMKFSLEEGYDPEMIKRISEGFNKQGTSPYIDVDRLVDVCNVFSDPGKFVRYMGRGQQKLKNGFNLEKQTKDVLTATKELRFVASLEGDRIGGFKLSSMTPGKQALFALKLILAEVDEPWPLLIDQPEDDLDSRSVVDVLVKDLMQRKRERQIIMVSHDANLVIGADSEEIIVANRHGDDRPNKGDRMFDYLSGSLEHSKPKNSKTMIVLDSAGIREHACELLDGGAEAFRKRKDKYRI